MQTSGIYYIDGKSLKLEEIRRFLESTAIINQKLEVLIAADESVALKYITSLIDLCRSSGFDNFSLQSR